MTAKEYLSQTYRIDQRVNSKLRQVDSLRDLATRATSTMGTEPVSGTRNVHCLEGTIDKIVDLENEINDDIDHLVDLRRKVMATISKVQNTNALMLLELRYLTPMGAISAEVFHAAMEVKRCRESRNVPTA